MSTQLVNIALIDDDEDDRIFFSVALRKTLFHSNILILDCREKIPSNIQTLENFRPDMLFIECLSDGKDYLEAIRKNLLLKDLFCVANSGTNYLNQVDLAVNAGANLFYFKSIELDEYVKILTKILTLNKADYYPPTLESFVIQN